MTNFRFTIAYDGTRYNGWQRQGNTANTIQGKIEHVLSEMTGHAVEIHGAGRTDAGVHALAQVAHTKLHTNQTPDEVRAYLTRYLPEDIAVLDCRAADERFHARLNAVGKRYRYRVWNSRTPNVFERKYLTRIEDPLDVNAMREAAALLCGTHDFKAFNSNKKMKKSTVRTVHAIEITQIGDEIRFDFHGTGFLYNMVRILTGTLIEVGLGTRAVDSIPMALESGDRQLAGRTMPAQGLTLVEVEY